jgi:membrane metallo-endopeptidase-like protein 1
VVVSTGAIRPFPIQDPAKYKSSDLYDSEDTNISPTQSVVLLPYVRSSPAAVTEQEGMPAWEKAEVVRVQTEREKLRHQTCRNFLGRVVPCSGAETWESPGLPVPVQDNTLSSQGLPELCLTAGCVGAANMLLQNMDQKADPCEDFYQFTCGGFQDRIVIPDDRSSWSQFSILDETLNQQLRILLEEKSPASEGRVFTKARDVYKACMNEQKIEELGMEPLLSGLHRMGGWPVLERAAWNEAQFSWIDTTYIFRQNSYSTDLLIDFSIGTDSKNSSWQVIDIDQASLGQAQVYLVKGMEDKTVKSYYKYMVNVAVLLGADRSVAEEEMMESLEFEMELAHASMPRELRRNATRMYNPMMIRDLSQYAPMVPWLEYINNILTPEILVVKDTERVILNEPGYLMNLTTLLEHTKKRTIANYMFFRAASSSLGYFTKAARKVQQDYSQDLTGTSSETPRWKECTGLASGIFSSVIGNLYVKKHFKEDAKKSMDEMVRDIRMEMEIILSKIDWMDEKTRARAQDKLSSMKEYIGYPDEILNVHLLEEVYQDLEVGSDTHFQNGIEIGKWSTTYVWSKIRDKVDKTDWKRHDQPAIVNAFYSSIENSIQFPAGILQGNFFGSDRPAYMNYGGIGWVIGHEITHGFDDQGRQFDDQGNLANWWEESTERNYLGKSQCIIWQYGNYTAESIGVPLNGINTQGENIADNGGIKEAYKGYNSWAGRNVEEPRLPGLQQFSPIQMFWISAGNTWCSKYRDAALERRIKTGAHSPGPFRVKGPFSNSADFSRDFHCPLGSVMNPHKKCEVW